MADPATRPYRIEIPNLIDDLDLSVYAFRLYVHIKRVAGPGGTCFEGTRKLAEKCGMSAGQVSKAKKELLDKGLVMKSSRATNGGETDELRPVDMWQQNYEAYTGQGVHTVNTLEQEDSQGVHTVNEGVHTVNERRNHEEGTNKNRAPRKSADAPPIELKQKSPHQAIVEAYAHALGYPIPDGAATGMAAKELVKLGYTPEQVSACYKSEKARDFWKDKHLTLMSLKKSIGAWAQAQARTTQATSIPLIQAGPPKPKIDPARVKAIFEEARGK